MLNSKPIIGAMFVCTALTCSTLAFYLAGILGAMDPDIDMLTKKWMYIQVEHYVPYWLIVAFVLVFAYGVYLLMASYKEKSKSK